jgi:peptide/nickel transport system substrate-binding protein
MSWYKGGGRLRKSVLVAPVAMVLAGVLTACGGGSGGIGNSSTTSGNSGQGSNATITDGGNLTVVTAGQSWPSLDPANPTIIPQDALIIPAFQPLWYTNSAGEVSPMLATSYKVSPDGKTYTIQLRQGVKFQDGTPFNAAAVAYNLQRYASKTVNSECVGYLSVMKSATATGNYTVTVQLSAPDASFVPVLASQQCSLMVSPTAVKTEGAAGFGSHPVGTGPYKYVGGTTGVVAKYSAWSDYWGGKPHLNGITVQNVSSAVDAYNALTSGTAQYWVYLNDANAVTQVEQAKSNAQLQVLTGPALSINYVAFNFTKPPFNNVLAREAVNYATDPGAIVKSLYGGEYRTVNGVFPPAIWDGALSLPVTGDGAPTNNIAKAKALVQQLGGLSFTLNIDNDPSWTAEAEALQSQLSQAGIKMTINPLETPQWIQSLHELAYQGLMIVSPNLIDPDMIAYRWFYSQSPLSQNGMKDPAADKLILQARATTSQSARTKIYQQLDKMLVTQAIPWDDLFGQANFQVASKKLQGLFLNDAGYIPWNTLGFS